MPYTIESIVQDNNRCGESPIWDPVQARLLWVDNVANLVFEYVPRTRARRVISRDFPVGAVALNRTGELVFAGSEGLYLWRPDGERRCLGTHYAGEPYAFNDIVADRAGRLYAGTLYWGADGMEKHGKLYLFDPAGGARVVDDGIELANGLGFSPDDRTLYFADSSARTIYAYDVLPQTGELRNKRVFVQVPRDEGIPDGLTVDADGFVWSAQWYGSQIVRYDPDGRVERRIPMPCTQVSSLIFGGEEWTDIYVTSAADSWEGSYAPPGYDFKAPNIGGSLYRVRCGIRGRPEHYADLPWRGGFTT